MQAAINVHRARNELSESSSEGSVRGDEGSLEDRRLSQEALDERTRSMRERGLPVRLFMEELPEDDGLYESRVHAEFVEDPNHPSGGYWHEAPPALLMIKVKPLPGFTSLRDRRRRPSELYHIALCLTSELHRFDLRDGSAGVRVARGLYGGLRERYHGKRALLRGWMQGTTLTLSRGTSVEGGNRSVVDDPDVRMFRAAGSYSDRDLQLAL